MEEVDPQSWEATKTSLTARKQWGDLFVLLGRQTIQKQNNVFENLSKQDELAVYNHLIGMGAEGFKWFKFWYKGVRRYRSTQKGDHVAKLLIYSENKYVQQAILDVLQESGSLQIHVLWPCYHRNKETMHPVETLKGIDFIQGLYLHCKAGVFSHLAPTITFDTTKNKLDTPLGWAAFGNQPDLVRLLYQAGAAVCNSEVLWLSRHPLLKKRCEAEEREEQPSSTSANRFPLPNDVDAAIEIREFLSSKASQPRSLKDLCLQEVTQHVGWGHERDRRVEQMDIPDVLKEMLTFKDGRLQDALERTTKEEEGNSM